mmetsp:Transcript_76329/g.120172  ORF Transcript_76329/g.120172 Transcript_76329/m.120172 type:complete len:415 (-) Transcript_76329:74-1318(-)
MLRDVIDPSCSKDESKQPELPRQKTIEVCSHLSARRGEKEFSVVLERQAKIDHFTRYANSMCQEAASRGDLACAEKWIEKLGAAGRAPDTQSFNNVLQATVVTGDLDRAERWFQKVLHPTLHPELRGLQPDALSYNIMVESLAKKENLPRAESYAADVKNMGMQLNQKSYSALVDACLKQGEVRRAHRWMEEEIAAGFAKPNKESMRRLIRGLADAGTVGSAERWISYMADMHLALDADTIAHVKAACPMEILSCQLSGESVELSPPRLRPIKFKGEETTALPHEIRPKRDAHIFMPPRSARATTTRWKVAPEVRQQATRNLPPALKAQFLTSSSGNEAITWQDELSFSYSARNPRPRYLGAITSRLPFSEAPVRTVPARGELLPPTTGRPTIGPPSSGPQRSNQRSEDFILVS